MTQPSDNPKVTSTSGALDSSQATKWFHFSIWLLLGFLGWAIGTFGLLLLVAPITGFGSVFPLIALFAASTVTLHVLLCRVFRITLVRIICGIGSFFLVFLYLDSGVSLMTAYLHSHPPPRPMFHNYFGPHERSLLPYWHQDITLSDDQGNLMWADHEDNVVVAVISGAPDGGWIEFPAGHESATFYVGDGSSEETVTIERTKNELVVLATDGSIGRYALAPDVVSGFCCPRRSERVANLFSDIEAILTPDIQQQLRTFLTASQSQ